MEQINFKDYTLTKLDDTFGLEQFFRFTLSKTKPVLSLSSLNISFRQIA